MRPEDSPTKLRTLGVCARLTSSLQSFDHITGVWERLSRRIQERSTIGEIVCCARTRAPVQERRTRRHQTRTARRCSPNVSYKVTTGGAAYALRLAGEGTSDYIDRAAEKHNAQVAAEAGVNAEVVYFDARDGTMVTRFVEGVFMNAGDGFGRDSGRRFGPRGRSSKFTVSGGFQIPLRRFRRDRGLPGPPAWLADAAARGLLRGRAEGEGGAPGAGGLSRCPRALPQ